MVSFSALASASSKTMKFEYKEVRQHAASQKGLTGTKACYRWTGSCIETGEGLSKGRQESLKGKEIPRRKCAFACALKQSENGRVGWKKSGEGQTLACRKRGYPKGGRSLFSVSVTFW